MESNSSPTNERNQMNLRWKYLQQKMFIFKYIKAKSSLRLKNLLLFTVQEHGSMKFLENKNLNLKLVY
jgi:hypothetical protein